MMKKILAVALTVVAGLGVQADTVNYTNSIPNTTLTDWNNTLNLTKFNPSLGTLNSINISLSSALSTDLSVTNNGASRITGSAYTDLQIFVDNPGTYDLFGLGGTNSPALTLNTPSFSFVLLGVTGYGTNSTTLSSGLVSTSSGDITDSSTLTLFTGTGSVGLPTFSYTQVGTLSHGNFSATQISKGGLEAVVTYDYTVPVPEPTTFAMIGAGLAGLGLVWRRRSAN